MARTLSPARSARTSWVSPARMRCRRRSAPKGRGGVGIAGIHPLSNLRQAEHSSNCSDGWMQVYQKCYRFARGKGANAVGKMWERCGFFLVSLLALAHTGSDQEGILCGGAVNSLLTCRQPFRMKNLEQLLPIERDCWPPPGPALVLGTPDHAPAPGATDGATTAVNKESIRRQRAGRERTNESWIQ
jgi:hypothetical protein